MTENTTLYTQDEPPAQAEADGTSPSKTPSSPDAPETAPCKSCGSTLPPDAQKLCPVPTCRAFRVGNRVAAIVGNRGADFWREQAGQLERLRARFLADAGFASSDTAPLTLDIVAHSMAQAVVVREAAFSHMTAAGGPLSESGKPRRAYTVWAASNEALIRDLRSAIAELATTPRPDRSSRDDAGVKAMPMSALEAASDLLQRVAAGEVLSEREQGRLDVLLAASHGKVLLPPDPDPLDTLTANMPPVNTRVTDDAEQEATHATAPKPETAITQPAVAEPTCPHCHQTTAACASARRASVDAWAEIHPDVIDHGDAEATRIMMHQIGRPSPW